MIRLFEIFQAVVSFGSISAASKALHISQPAVSVAIKDLENHYQCQLFNRVGKRLMINEQGIWLYSQINELMKQLSTMEEHLRNHKAFQRIRIAASLSVGSTVLAKYVRAYQNQYPAQDIRVSVEHNQSVEQKLIRNECDLALIEGVCNDERVISMPFFNESMICIAPIDFSHNIISMEQCSETAFLAREPGSATRFYVDSIMSANGIRLNIKWQSHSIEAILLGVESGLGISILPESTVATAIETKKCKKIEIAGISFKRVVSIAFRKEKAEDDAILAWCELINKTNTSN